jgi:hypothetical protein
MAPRHFELLEGAVIDALAGIDYSLETLECGGGGGEGVAGDLAAEAFILPVSRHSLYTEGTPKPSFRFPAKWVLRLDRNFGEKIQYPQVLYNANR